MLAQMEVLVASYRLVIGVAVLYLAQSVAVMAFTVAQKVLPVILQWVCAYTRVWMA